MTRLPQLKPKELTSIVKKLGFEAVRQKGSHAIFQHSDGRHLTIPIHNKPLAAGTLYSIIKKDLQISKEEFIELIK